MITTRETLSIEINKGKKEIPKPFLTPEEAIVFATDFHDTLIDECDLVEDTSSEWFPSPRIEAIQALELMIAKSKAAGLPVFIISKSDRFDNFAEFVEHITKNILDSTKNIFHSTIELLQQTAQTTDHNNPLFSLFVQIQQAITIALENIINAIPAILSGYQSDNVAEFTNTITNYILNSINEQFKPLQTTIDSDVLFQQVQTKILLELDRLKETMPAILEQYFTKNNNLACGPALIEFFLKHNSIKETIICADNHIDKNYSHEEIARANVIIVSFNPDTIHFKQSPAYRSLQKIHAESVTDIPFEQWFDAIKHHKRAHFILAEQMLRFALNARQQLALTQKLTQTVTFVFTDDDWHIYADCKNPNTAQQLSTCHHNISKINIIPIRVPSSENEVAFWTQFVVENYLNMTDKEVWETGQTGYSEEIIKYLPSPWLERAVQITLAKCDAYQNQLSLLEDNLGNTEEPCEHQLAYASIFDYTAALINCYSYQAVKEISSMIDNTTQPKKNNDNPHEKLEKNINYLTEHSEIILKNWQKIFNQLSSKWKEISLLRLQKYPYIEIEHVRLDDNFRQALFEMSLLYIHNEDKNDDANETKTPYKIEPAFLSMPDLSNEIEYCALSLKIDPKNKLAMTIANPMYCIFKLLNITAIEWDKNASQQQQDKLKNNIFKGSIDTLLIDKTENPPREKAIRIEQPDNTGWSEEESDTETDEEINEKVTKTIKDWLLRQEPLPKITPTKLGFTDTLAENNKRQLEVKHDLKVRLDKKRKYQ